MNLVPATDVRQPWHTLVKIDGGNIVIDNAGFALLQHRVREAHAMRTAPVVNDRELVEAC